MGSGIIQWAIARPVSVTVGVILVLLFGALSIAGIPIQLTPDVQIPSITVETRWPGATPTEVEAELLEPQEEALKSLPGLDRMTSEAKREQASITLELEVGSSLDEALVRVSNLLAQVPEYPQTARRPVITTADSSGPPLVVIVIQSDPPGLPVAQYGTWVDEVIVPRLERIRGVAGVRFVGGREQEVHIDFEPQKLAARGITVGAMVGAVRSELTDVSAGDVPIGKRRYVVRTQVTPSVSKDLERTVLATSPDGTPVLLGQVATVNPGLRKRSAAGLVDGAPMMALLFFREAGSNVLEVTQNIHREVDALQENYLAPEGLSMRIVSDQTDYIEGALTLVRNNLLLGGVLAVVVLLLFLRSIGASAVVAVSIPISIVGTVLAMSAMGRTINIVSLSGMAFAVGMVVDNSIVVLENIETHRAREASVARAALLGAREVWGAILASTLTTAAVFIPIISWQDEVGQLLRDVAMAVVTAVFVSLAVSVIVIPSFAALLLRSKRRPSTPDSGADARNEDLGRTGRTVHRIVSSRLGAALLSLIGIVGATTLGFALVPAMEYLPTGNRNIVFGVVIPPPGYSVDEMERIGHHIEDQLVPHTGVEKDGVPALSRSFFVGMPDSAFMGAVAEDPKRVGEVATLIRNTLRTVPDVIGIANQGSLFGRSLGSGRAIEIDVSGANLVDVVGFSGRLMGALREAMPGAQVRPIPGLDVGAPEWRVEPRRDQAASLGVSSSETGLIVDAYIDGAIIGELGRAGEPKRDVVVQAANMVIDSPKALESAPAAVPGGKMVPLGEFARVSRVMGPTVIRRIERRRTITLQISPPEELALEDALTLVREDVVGGLQRAGAVPDGVRIDYAGSAGKLDDAKSRFGFVLLLALVITFLLLAALFEDFLAPLAILFTVPLAGAGGVVGLLLVDKTLGPQPLDMLTALGFVILLGVVVNNAILIVDGALSRMREQGLSLEQSVASAVRWRVRPIMMSALTSLAGLLPLVLFPGSGSELYRGVGGVVLGGLALSTVLSLYLVPAVFTTLWRLRGLARSVTS